MQWARADHLHPGHLVLPSPLPGPALPPDHRLYRDHKLEKIWHTKTHSTNCWKYGVLCICSCHKHFIVQKISRFPKTWQTQEKVTIWTYKQDEARISRPKIKVSVFPASNPTRFRTKSEFFKISKQHTVQPFFIWHYNNILHGSCVSDCKGWGLYHQQPGILQPIFVQHRSVGGF